MIFSCLIIFPNQLYELSTSFFKFYDYVFLVEDPIFFNEKFKSNKIKIAYLRASSKCYFDYIQTTGKKLFVEYDKVDNYNFLKTFEINEITLHDPTDFNLMSKLKKLKIKLTILPSPNFIMSLKDLSSKTYTRHKSFYIDVKKHLHILESTPNLDKYNRKSFPKNYPSPPSPYKFKVNKYYREGIKFANSDIFKDHVGNPENVTLYPITHKDAMYNFEIFLRERFNNFGTYQDAILKSECILYHSNISATLNAGLLDPKKVVKKIASFKNYVTLESYEGFLRQIIGWREYMRYLYVFNYNKLISYNLPQNNMTFKDSKVWYTGTTGLYPIDTEIRKALDTGYSHHIVRLMIFMNFFILCNVHPQTIYKWFMEVISIDAYDWVMTSNIYAMGFFSPIAMTRPYLSTSAYILRMSDYKKDGKWNLVWDSLFHGFVSTKPKKYIAAYMRNLRKRDHLNLELGKEYIQNNFVPYTAK